MENKKEELLKMYVEYAEKNNIALNPNERIVEAVIDGLLNREQINGEKYCPCRKVSGEKEEDKKIICPCVYNLEEVETMGHCHCNLFVKK